MKIGETIDQIEPEPSMKNKSAFLVTGGAGYIGTAMVKMLSRSGETVVSMYRHRLPEPCDKVFPVCSDLTCEELLAAPLRGVGTVIHLAWDKNFIGLDPNIEPNPKDKKNWTKNIRILQNLISAMEKAKTERIIFVSAYGVGRTVSDPFLIEKYIGEYVVLNSKIPEKLILRPSILYGGGGNRDRFLQVIRRLMRFPGFYPVPKCRHKIHPIFVDDFAKLCGKLAGSKLDEPVKVYDLIGEEGLKIEEIFKQVSEKYGKNTKIPLGSMIGSSLLPLFEKDLKNDKVEIKLRHLLALGIKNPLLQQRAESHNLLGKQILFQEGLNRSFNETTVQ